MSHIVVAMLLVFISVMFIIASLVFDAIYRYFLLQSECRHEYVYDLTVLSHDGKGSTDYFKCKYCDHKTRISHIHKDGI